MQASPAEHRSYLWSVPGKRLAVDLALTVVKRIVAEATDGLQTVGRGLEAGGLLLGRTRRERGRIVVEVDDTAPIDCEHVAGPSFMLSAADRQVLETRLRRRKGDVVGFYRSNTRREFAITVEDVALMSWYFPAESNVFLLVDAPRQGPLRGAFVLWEGRAMGQKTADDEFPFDPVELEARSHAVAARIAPAPPVAAKPASGPGKAAWYAAAAVAIGITGGVVYDQATKAPMPPAPRRAQARVPPVNAQPPPAAPEIAPETEPDEPPPVAEPVATKPVAPPPVALPPVAAQPVAPAPPAAAPAPRTQSADRRVLEPPPIETPDAPPPELAEAPAVNASILPAAAGSLAVLNAPASPPSPPSIPRPTATDSLVSVSLNAVTRGKGPKFIPPTAVRQVRPELPPDLRRRLTREVQIRVKVYVDRAGKVSYAELLSDGTGENRDLASLAVFASRRWQFAPASRGGKVVEAQAVLQYRFGPEAR